MNIIFSDRREHAEYFARQIKNWRGSEYRETGNYENVRSLCDCTLWIVTAPRHNRNYLEIRTREMVEIFISTQAAVRRIKVERVTLQ